MQTRATTLRALATYPRKAWPTRAPMPDPRPAIVCTDRGSPEQPLRDCRGQTVAGVVSQLTIIRTDQATDREARGRWR